MQWSVELIMSRIQELLGEFPGDFYNYQTRLMLINQAQDEMLRNSEAFRKTVELAYDPTVGVDFPEDFLNFTAVDPHWKSSTGEHTALTIASEFRVQELNPFYKDADTADTPTHLIDSDLSLYPTPSNAGTLVMSYYYRPYYLQEEGDVPLGGHRVFGSYADALSYWVAARVLIASNSQLSGTYQSIYQQEEAKLREEVRKRKKERFIRTTNIGEWI